MLFPVTNKDLVLVGKECGISSKSWFWHFTICEEHEHLFGQPWQDCTTARSKSKYIIPDLISPRFHPDDVLSSGRILGCRNVSARSVRKNHFTTIQPVTASFFHRETFFPTVCPAFILPKAAPTSNSHSMQLPPNHPPLGHVYISTRVMEKWTRLANFSVGFSNLKLIYIKAPRYVYSPGKNIYPDTGCKL